MSAAQRLADRFRALDPERSIVVEACAGSGKTWLLVSRLVRAMLAGARPGQILAITYTRKAAREIEARLRAVLAELATRPDEDLIEALRARGVVPAGIPALVPRARALYEEVLAADPPITITTFHGWFARLISGAPMETGLAGRGLEEAASGLVDEAWAMLAARCGREAGSDLAQSLLGLYATVGAHGTRRLMHGFLDRRAEWRVWRDRHGGLEGTCAAVDETFGLDTSDPVGAFPDPTGREEIVAFAGLAAQNGARGVAMADGLFDALALAEPASRFDAVRAALLTAANEPRAMKPLKEFLKQHGDDGGERLTRLFASLCERVIDILERQRERAAGLVNLQVFAVGEALLQEYDKLKRSRRVMDFADLECEVDRLLAQEGSGAFLQARLDARYRHILLDEFQDTNPLQWRILRGWLDSYGAGGGEAPRIFLVGDPKQSIYRFRRAEPRLFDTAAHFFRERFAADHIRNAHTFRNSGVVVKAVNELFGHTAALPGFVAQTSEREAWPGRIEIQPLVARSPGAASAEANRLRNPLLAPRIEEEDVRRAEEGALLARRIGEMVGAWRVRERDGSERLARFGDILILTRRTTHLATYEHVLRTAGIPFFSLGRGNLLETPEARDLLSVLRFLADPKDDLALAQVLRCPLFQVGNEVLLELSASRGDGWWANLRELAREGHADLARAARLLLDWIDAAQHLPAHDLLDRMFDRGEWMRRYRSAAPPELWPGIQANLEAMLELALDVDAGRYPSLTRFVDELARIASTDDEAPDEGVIQSVAAHAGRVRIMTIHGAKGLEAPIVWLIDAHTPPRGREGCQVLIEWPTETLQPTHFSVVGSLAEAAKIQRELLHQEDLAAEREELNLLYVALTRAEQVFIVSGIEPTRTLGKPTAYARLRDAVEAVGGGSALGGMPAGAGRALADETEHRPVADARRAMPMGVRRPFVRATPGQSFGTSLHAWLEAAMDGLPRPRVSEDVATLGHKLLDDPGLARFFDRRRYVVAGNETTFIDELGKVGRIDRWVDCGDAIWVLDYKTGGIAEGATLQDYRRQVGHYCGVLSGIFPGRLVRGLLIFTDGARVEVRAFE